MKIAVVGATGLVGREMLTVLEERGFGKEEIIAAASPKSVGKEIEFAGRRLTVKSVDDAIAARPQYAIFSAGAAASREYAPRFTEVGTTVIDNSSAWRKVPEIPLVVPEINIDVATNALKQSRNHAIIIANPNCSTIQMVLALSALERRYGIRRLVIATYQSITGTGIKAVRQLEAEEGESLKVNCGRRPCGAKGERYEMAYPCRYGIPLPHPPQSLPPWRRLPARRLHHRGAEARRRDPQDIRRPRHRDYRHSGTRASGGRPQRGCER